ncbi:hypothetical protein [Mesorhizobium sp. CO1-1-8]|uniref:hypothetical protein n=1 Tax=Mesorhizobium sp. CO1-1-8 TaxID=2876631 RepID=UPI001CD04685|nr:hypothetical protein [Mesorhizobium sp. CO1-1-8]MBZ9772620.1 hypothetical protein [Mesorhizobium sp. CO1-1-8]
MADLTTARAELAAAKHNAEVAKADTEARDRALARLERRLDDLERSLDARDEQQVAARDDLRRKRGQARSLAETTKALRKDALEKVKQAAADFAAFTDPRINMPALATGVPILMLPVRIETRFKPAAAAEPHTPAHGDQLWLRIYPDDCWIDTFDQALSEAEAMSAARYWAGLWQAGQIEAEERAAWRALAEAHGTGRARYIVSLYPDLSAAPRPVRVVPSDVVLTIVLDAPRPDAEATALIAYWQAAFLAANNAARLATARASLAASLPAADLDALLDATSPTNLAAASPRTADGSEPKVSVAILVVPPIATGRSTLGATPRMTILPERFVFIGQRAGEAPLVVMGEQVPTTVAAGVDPNAQGDDQLHHDDDGNLVMSEDVKWMSDFDAAIVIGLAMRIDLTPAQLRGGFDRVFVVGIRFSTDAVGSAAEWEALLLHHLRSRKGLAVVGQGTPTNNTEAGASGHGRLDDPDAAFDALHAPQFTVANAAAERRDGQWLADALGIDPAVFQHVTGAAGTDRRTARAMHEALWPSTLGYWMETLMAPAFDAKTIERTRLFFAANVVAGGGVGTIRIGNQPYGIMPATAFSRMTWLTAPGAGPLLAADNGDRRYLAALRRLIASVEPHWRTMADGVSFVGKPGDPHRTLLDIVGLHSGSVEWSQRYADSLKVVFNQLSMLGLGGLFETIRIALERVGSMALLRNFGFAGESTPQLLELLFHGKHNLLKGGVVDDRPLSESNSIRAWTSDGRDYLDWLDGAARTSLDALYRQDGFVDDKPPKPLLYIMLRHALQLGYYDVAVRLREDAGLLTGADLLAARVEQPFLHISDTATLSESRYRLLLDTAPTITGLASRPLAEHIALQLEILPLAFGLRTQLAAIERLKGQPTAQLERAFADHADCLGYRLDAWLLGLVNVQLGRMRGMDETTAATRRGLHLGAFGWLEEVRPENKVLTPVVLDDPKLEAVFGSPEEPPLMRDSTSQGYVHAPSLNHAVTAAVLRNGYLSNAGEQNAETLAVNLSSARVRTGLSLLEGIRGGQSLGDLLGYRFERGLHDRHAQAEVDKFIFELRKAFPLRFNRMASTTTEEAKSVESIAARNVVDGLALVEHMRKTGNKAYPFGKSGLPHATPDEAKVISEEAGRIADAHDAVADLALGEGVYQAVMGNYDRVAATYDAYARGAFPPEPDIARTPLQGVGITHRVALHLDAGTDPSLSPIAAVSMTPRALAEPALNRWLATVLPPSADIGLTVTFRDAATGTQVQQPLRLADLALQPIDIVAIVAADVPQAMAELDDRVWRHVGQTFGARPDVRPVIQYMGRGGAPLSLFELTPLCASLRQLLDRCRPLKPTDLALVNEATIDLDGAPEADPGRLVTVRDALAALKVDCMAYLGTLEALLADTAVNEAAILSGYDAHLEAAASLLQRATAFGIREAGWGGLYETRQRLYREIIEQTETIARAWATILGDHDAAMLDYAALPANIAGEERFRILVTAEKLIATTQTVPAPATPVAYVMVITARRAAFAARLGQLAGLSQSARTTLSDLYADATFLWPLDDFRPGQSDLGASRTAMMHATEDLQSLIEQLSLAVGGRVKRADDGFAAHAAALDPAESVAALESVGKSLFGEDFRLIPRFRLSAARSVEVANALAACRSGTTVSHLTAPADPSIAPIAFPVDTWLHGVARVREKMHACEETMILGAALGGGEPSLDALQLPFAPDDRWLGLAFPPDRPPSHDELLYTAIFAAPFDGSRLQCGLLLDEWSEMIPGDTAQTGITFHHDRPNTEAPQTMLLVTPSDHHAPWAWEDLVDALGETLDLAKLRAVEPVQVDASPFAPFLPATVMATQVNQLTIAAHLALNNAVKLTGVAP